MCEIEGYLVYVRCHSHFNDTLVKLMSTHITQPSSNAVPLEVEEDLAILKSTVWYQQRILEYQQRDSRKLNLELKNWKMKIQHV